MFGVEAPAGVWDGGVDGKFLLLVSSLKTPLPERFSITCKNVTFLETGLIYLNVLLHWRALNVTQQFNLRVLVL